MSKRLAVLGLLPVALLQLLIGAGCGRDDAHAGVVTLTIYSGRGENLVKPVIDQFSKLSGVQVQVRWGGTAELAATIMEEGRNTPADIFFAQDPGALGALQDRFVQLPSETLDLAQPRFRSPDGKWVGISGRARTVVYNTDRLTDAGLPDDMWGFTEPQWKGRIGWAPTNGSFQVMVTAMRKLWGEDKTRLWLEGIKANDPKVYSGNAPIVQATGAGEIDVGFVNHYYLFRFLAEEGESFPARNYHPRAGGPGALVMVSGIGVLSTSKNQKAAFKLVDFLLSDVGQQFFASQTFEYPVVEGIQTPRALVPISNLNAPDIDLKDLADLDGTLRLLQEVGIL
jgi:iron(III) transport system substrate-binding protein